MDHGKIFQRLFLLALIAMILAACSTPTNNLQATPSTAAMSPETATAAYSIVENLADNFVMAYETENATNYLGLFTYEAIFADNSTPFRSYVTAELVRNSGNYVNNLFKNTNFRLKFSSHIVSRDGRFIALTGTYTKTGKDGNLASVPIVIVLEVKDGKIIREDQYYDNSLFY